MLYEGSIYCCDIYLDSKKISRYQLSDGEISSFEVPFYSCACIYNDYFYGVCETEGKDKKREVNIYRINLNNERFETICEYSFDYGASGGRAVSQL
ncbi:MAG: hypothetical protein K2G55_19350 [Lachnospiraceae bacterium]|nr:hypothetical protein [Lachnospiraceae bacterium]MDE7204351.1 hypothetical protein [Lachnospiraceae bacterium]